MMKKMFLSLLCLIMGTTINGQTMLNGDLNHDGAISIADVTALVRVVLNKADAEVIDFTSLIPDTHEYVDLGLPSGTLWATCNIGARSPEDYGLYFAWGETTGYKNGKACFDWSTYTYCNAASYVRLTKYCNDSNSGDNGFSDNLVDLLPEDDAAYANWGSEWNMPTIAQFEELINSSYTTTTWTTQNGVYGRLITSKMPGYTDRRIFLPAAGYLGGTTLTNERQGYYWSRTLGTAGPHLGRLLFLHPDELTTDENDRCCGRSIRPVRRSVLFQRVTNIALSQKSLSMKGGDTQTLIATVSPSDATDKSVTWTSSDESVAVISTSGLVTAVASGSCTITCMANDGSGIVATCAVTVVKDNWIWSGEDFIAESPCVLLDLTERNGYNEESGDYSRHVYSARYMLTVAGVPYTVTSDLEKALESDFVLFSSPILKKTFTAAEAATLKAWVEAGGTLMAPALSEATNEVCELFGVSGSKYLKTRNTYTWETDHLLDKELEYMNTEEEIVVSLGNAEKEESSIKTYAYTPTTGESMATFDTGETAVVRHCLGKGRTYTFGVLWRDVIQRSQLNKDFSAARATNNCFEPSADIYAFFLRSAFALTHEVSAWKFTVPGGYESLVIPTHDCDSRTAYDEMHYMSDYEASLGLSAQYMLTVHYFRQEGYLSAFYNDETIPKSRELIAKGHTVGSHSVCHFPDFDVTSRFPITVVSRDEYLPTHDPVTHQTTSGGSTWAELMLSKQIIEEDLGNRVRTFRSGHLCMNKNIPQVLAEGGYDFSTCYSASDVLSEFPFRERIENNWTGEHGTLQMPLHISDVMYDAPMSEENWMDKPAIWLDVLGKLAGNYAPAILLIHPNREWKMLAEKMLVERMDRSRIGLWNLEAWGDFWLAREKMDFRYCYVADKATILIKPDDAENELETCLFALDVQEGVNVDHVILLNKEGQGMELTFREIAKGRLLATLPGVEPK